MTGAGNKTMSPQELATPTAFALGFITFGLVLTAGASMIGTAYTIAPHQVRSRALKTLAAAAVTGAAAAVVSTNF